MRTLTLVACVSTLVLAQGCKKKRDLPEKLHVQVVSTDLALTGATLIAGDQRASFAREHWSSSGDAAIARLEVKRESGPLVGHLAIELVTPCGVRPQQLEVKQTVAEETEARTIGTSLFLDVKPTTLPASTDVWIDLEKKQSLRIGTADVPIAPRVRLFEPSCGEAPVVVDGAEVGRIDAAKLEHHSVFVTGDAGACYTHEYVSYGTSPSSRTTLKGHSVYYVASGDIEYFLKKAPSSKSVSTSGGGVIVRELVKAKCP